MAGTHLPSVFRRLEDLSDEEVAVLARDGNKQAVEHLLDRYRGLVEGKARSYFLVGADREDVIQEGMIGLFKAIRDYRAERLPRFRAFAELCVTRQIISAIKGATRQKHVPLNQYISLHRQREAEESGWLELLPDQRVCDPEAVVLGRRLSEYFERWAGQELSDLECRVVLSRLQGKSYRQTARELNCRPKSVDNALQRAKRKIWNRLTQTR